MTGTDARVVFLYGDDEFAMARRLAEFGAIFSDPSAANMNTARLEARTMSEDDLNNAVNALPFLAKSRLVLLANPSARYSKPETRKKFFEFLQKVPETARLVMYENVELKTFRDRGKQDKEDEKHWLVKWLRKAGLGLERFALPGAREMAGWVSAQVKEQGGQIEPAAAARLAEMVGADTRRAAQEAAKLLAYVNWARPVHVADVEAVCSVTAQADIFAMVDALAGGDGRTSQKLMRRLLQDGDPFSVWGMVVRQFRLLLLAREVMDRRGGPRELEQALGLHAFVAQKVFDQAKRFSLSSLELIHHRLLEVDEAAKTGRMALDLALETLVVELTRSS